MAKSPAHPPVPEGPAHAFLADDATRAVVEAVLGEVPGATPKVELGGIGAALKRLDHESVAALVIVDVSQVDDGGSAVADLMSVIDGGTRVIVIGETNDVALFRSLLSVGVSDYLVKPIDKRMLRAAVNAALKPPGASETAAKQGRIAAFFATRGGLGSTTIAINVAALLAHEWNIRVALIDLDLHFGTVALNFGLEPAGGLREALERPERVDSLFIERAMTKYSEKLFVLGAEEPLAHNLSVDPAAMRSLLTALQHSFDVVMVDLPRGLSPVQRHTLSVADHVFVVSELSLAGVRDCLRVKAMLKELDGNGRPIYIASALNGRKRAPIAANDFKDTVGERLAVVLPNDEKGFALAATASKPVCDVAKGSAFVKALRPLAAELSGKKAAPAAEPFWRRFLSKPAALKPAKA
jgi:pilus assembly protein CpaE